MNTALMSQMEARMDKLTKLQRKVADYVLSEPIQAAFMTVDQLAHAVGVSTATVVRFSTELGYGGYTEFQSALQEYMKNRARPSAKLQVSMEHSSGDGPIAMSTQLVLSNIERTMEGLSEQTLEAIVRKILGAEKVFCAGLRTSACVSSYLGYNLGRMLDAPCILCENTGDFAEQIRRITERDVVFAITMSRYSRQIVEFTKLAKQKGATVIAFTDGYATPLAQYADHQLVAKTSSDGFHNSVVAFCYVVDILLSLCCKKAPDQVRKNLKASEQVLSETNFMITK